MYLRSTPENFLEILTHYRYKRQNKEALEIVYCGGGKYLGMISGFAGAAAAAAAAAAVLQQAAAAESTWATSFHHHHPHPHYHHHPSPSKRVFLTFFLNLLCN